MSICFRRNGVQSCIVIMRSIRILRTRKEVRLPSVSRQPGITCLNDSLRHPLRLAQLAIAVGLALTHVAGASAADLQDAQRRFYTGKYAECARLAAAEIEAGAWHEDWRCLKIEAELATGKYGEAAATADEALSMHPLSLELRLLAHTANLYAGRQLEAAAVLDEAERLIADNPRRYGSPPERVALARFLLKRGADPRQILELIYDQLREHSPEYTETYLATAELALDKHDYAVAADTLEAAPKSVFKNPRYFYLLARAYANSNPAKSDEKLKTALKINPRHIDSLLLEVEQAIDGEQYVDADALLQKVLDVNLQHPTAWAYKAALAHLTGDGDTERQSRQRGLAAWSNNPEVDHLIGLKLSQKYRFAEGAAYQRQSLVLDPRFKPAKIQLSQDLLRLGDEEGGWKLAGEILEQDQYNVLAFNLVTLQEEITKYRTIGSDGIMVRMEAREAALYGQRVLELLHRARRVLPEKYAVELTQPILIEIFPHQKDFAVRTFGLPGADGFLGVCFGRVITANSPASQGEHPANWEAVLWHEFCHAVTLHKTRNKMPRWLSEGISVYEERQANPTWGQSMTPQYREMIVNGEMTPVSQLSSAFLSPPSPLHLQFAYYESSLVVEFLVDRYGFDALKLILADLGDGMNINETLIRHTAPLGRLDAEFAVFARERAEALAPSAVWDKPDLPADASAEAISTWLSDHPNNYWAQARLAQQLLRERKFAEALEAAKRLQELYPDASGPESALIFLARAAHGLNDIDAEQAALEELAERDGDATDAYLRLIEIAEDRDDWKSVARNARRMLAVNPLVAAPHRALARAAEEIGNRKEAIEAYRALLQFDTTDVAETHYRLAGLLRAEDQRDEAKRQILLALDEAPRYLAAHRLLLELVEPAKADKISESATAEIDQDANAVVPATAPAAASGETQESEP